MVVGRQNAAKTVPKGMSESRKDARRHEKNVYGPKAKEWTVRKRSGGVLPPERMTLRMRKKEREGGRGVRGLFMFGTALP